MPQGTRFGRAGVPDFICCRYGLFIGIEAKSSCTGHPWSVAQQDIAKEIRMAKGYYYVVDENGLYALFQDLNKDIYSFWVNGPAVLDLRGKDND